MLHGRCHVNNLKPAKKKAESITRGDLCTVKQENGAFLSSTFCIFQELNGKLYSYFMSTLIKFHLPVQRPFTLMSKC